MVEDCGLVWKVLVSGSEIRSSVWNHCTNVKKMHIEFHTAYSIAVWKSFVDSIFSLIHRARGHAHQAGWQGGTMSLSLYMQIEIVNHTGNR